MDVTVVGAGPAGTLLATLLAEQGHTVALIERNSHIAREFRGEHLNDLTVTLLQRHGLWPEVEAAGYLPIELIQMMDGPKPILSITPELFGITRLGLHIPQENLLRPMINHASKSGRFHILLGHSVNNLLRDASNRVIGVECKTREGTARVLSRVVVAADGRFSNVRKLSGLPVRTWKHGYDVLWAKIPAPVGWPAAMRFGFYGNTGFSLFSAFPDRVQLGWRISEGEFPKLRQQPFERFADVICAAAPALAPMVRDHLRQWSDFTVLSVQSCMMDRWAEDGLLFIGDAAHTMSPSGGIGVNAALADGEMAAEVLADALRKDDLSAESLGELERRRRPIIEQQQATQLRQEEQNLRMSKNRAMRWFGNRMMRQLDRSPERKRAFFEKQYVISG